MRENEGSKDNAAIINHAGKLISLLWKLKENISDKAKAKLKEVMGK